MALTVKTKSEIFANLYRFLQSKTDAKFNSKQKIIHYSLEYLENLLILTNQLPGKLSKGEAFLIIEEVFPEIDIAKIRELNQLLDVPDEELDRVRKEMENLK